jgi:hypothetical protein
MRISGRRAAVSLRANIDDRMHLHHDALEVLMALPEIAYQRKAEAVRLELCHSSPCEQFEGIVGERLGPSDNPISP